jgi:hypothetical protein
MVPGSSDVLAEVFGGKPQRTGGPPPSGEMGAILQAAAALHRRGRPALKIRRFPSDDGPGFWRWDCARCGEYGGGRHHPDAITRAMRHCGEHPDHRSSLLPPTRCREPEVGVPAHPMLFAVDDDLPPPPLAT